MWKLACRVSAKRLFPNFSNLDVDYNAEIYDGTPDTEVAYMGCRTRVASNVYDKSKSVVTGRGNLSFTSINLPRLAIEADGDIDKFMKSLDDKMYAVRQQLLDRLELISSKMPINFPFLMGQGVWIDSDSLGPTDEIRDVIKHGTLTVGFIGLAETLKALIGKHHGESKEAQELGLEIVGRMRSLTDSWSEKEHLNYSVIATPAEGLSGRFVGMDQKRYGIIPGVTDKDYYTNSFHVPVKYKISANKKIKLEAPYHRLCNGGHITYVELDGDPLNNIEAFEKVVMAMYKHGIGYGAINHPVDRDPVCGYIGIIGDTCPRCGRKDGEPMNEEVFRALRGYANVKDIDYYGILGDSEERLDRLTNSVK